ncbi:DUF748 domain-containing protein [Bordetella genomosp. 7]|uniref:DUF748 domain-containing protein n=1 Tax=Bordetella genomosp. 7 TaxID=1416805 RepID=A0A261QZD8_9BORD|nr:DUF748 domain-containing protein [Bordetella genomosp. 7]OZI18145.1 hypothetical protein CAL19_13895 [Bordetella genomosp. 7]
MAFRMPTWIFTRRFGKIVLATVAVVLVLMGLAAWQVPKVLRNALTADVAGLLGRPVQVGHISFNPFTLTVRARDLAIEQPGAASPLLDVEQLEVSASWMSLFWFAPVVDSVRVQGPRLALVRNDAASFNFSDIQQKLAADAAARPRPDEPDDGAMARFSLNNLVLENGAITLDDQVTGRQHQVDEITLGVPFISTFGYATDIDVQPRVHLRINGSPFDLYGVARPFDVVPASTLNVQFSGLELEKLADAWPVQLPVKVERALLDSDLQIVFEQPRDAAPKIKVMGELGLRQLDVRETSGDALLHWSTLNVRRIALDPMARQLAVGQVELWSPVAQTRRDASARVNWLQVIEGIQALGAGQPPDGTAPAGKPAEAAADTASAPASTSAPAAPDMSQAAALASPAPVAAATPDGWQVAVDAININDAELRLRDTPTQLDYTLAGLALTVENVQFPQPPDQPINLWLTMDNASDGAWIRAKGPLHLSPLALNLDVRAGHLALAPFAAALRSQAPIQLLDGSLGLQAQVRVAGQEGATAVSATNVQAELADLSLRDESVKPAVNLSLASLNLAAERVALDAQASPFTLAATGVQGAGQLQVQGTLAVQPLAVQAQVDLQNLDVASLAPYVASSLNATVRSVAVGARGQAVYAAPAGGNPMKASWQGAIDISGLDLADRVNRDDFLKWKRLALANMHVSVNGDRYAANLGDITLDDFYGRVVLSAEGRLNVMDLVAEPGQAGGSITQDTQTRGRAARQPDTSGQLPDITVNSITLANGRMNFTDRFVKPNYTAELSRIEGGLSAVSSRNPKPAKVKVTGRVYGTAPLSISGAVQPFAEYLSLDLKASAKGVDLPRFTTYSSKYVGYPIKRGKLSLDLEYKLKGRSLQASNHVVLNQLTFGDKTDSPDATKLPVMLAVALLKDSRGNIDINLPISGSLDDPQFSVGGIIVRVLVNLVVKAVSSPFSLLASAFGGGEELSYINFEPGSAIPGADADERIATLAQALNDRPGLKLDIIGRADPQTDIEGLRQAWVDLQIRKAKAAATAGRGRQPDPAGITVSGPERAKYLEEAYDDTDIEDKPRNFLGFSKSVPPDQMEALLRQAAPVGEDDLRRLADARAQAVYEKLQETGPADRIFVVASSLDGAGGEGEAAPSRVDFALR